MRFARQRYLLFLALAGIGFSGCADRYGGRQAVSGTVMFQGKPLDQGSIMFLPASDGLPTQSGTTINNGSYTIPREQGLVPGTYKVAISSPDGKTPDPGSDALPGPSGNFASKDRIPPEFNTESKHEVEVKKDASNTFDFKIP
jgi:hypothetical protein